MLYINIRLKPTTKVINFLYRVSLQKTFYTRNYKKNGAATTLYRGHDDLHLDMGTSGDTQRETAMEWHQCARTHGFLVASCSLKKILVLAYRIYSNKRRPRLSAALE